VREKTFVKKSEEKMSDAEKMSNSRKTELNQKLQEYIALTHQFTEVQKEILNNQQEQELINMLLIVVRKTILSSRLNAKEQQYLVVASGATARQTEILDDEFWKKHFPDHQLPVDVNNSGGAAGRVTNPWYEWLGKKDKKHRNNTNYLCFIHFLNLFLPQLQARHLLEKYLSKYTIPDHFSFLLQNCKQKLKRINLRVRQPKYKHKKTTTSTAAVTT
jgi:hypothetical protein